MLIAGASLSAHDGSACSVVTRPRQVTDEVLPQPLEVDGNVSAGLLRSAWNPKGPAEGASALCRLQASLVAMDPGSAAGKPPSGIRHHRHRGDMEHIVTGRRTVEDHPEQNIGTIHLATPHTRPLRR